MEHTTYIEYLFDDASGLFRRSQRSDTIEPCAVVVASDARAALLRASLSCPSVRLTTRAQLASRAAQPGTIVFIDRDLLHLLAGIETLAPVVCIVDPPAQQSLSYLVGVLEADPWLSHFVSAALLTKPFARAHLGKLVARLAVGDETGMVEAGVGRVALLARASRRDERLERMREFFEKHGTSARLIEKITEVFEELTTNALYDAPVEAGYFPHAVPRTQDVALPADRACQITYGVEDGTLALRVRDPFGALGFRRLLAVLTRCNQVGAALDETRGGAGLGLWRIFSLASTVAITVIPGRLTEVIVGFEAGGRAKQLLAVDLHFAPDAAFDSSHLEAPDADQDVFDRSVTLVRVA